jgi:hypothetical protein
VCVCVVRERVCVFVYFERERERERESKRECVSVPPMFLFSFYLSSFCMLFHCSSVCDSLREGTLIWWRDDVLCVSSAVDGEKTTKNSPLRKVQTSNCPHTHKTPHTHTPTHNHNRASEAFVIPRCTQSIAPSPTGATHSHLFAYPSHTNGELAWLWTLGPPACSSPCAVRSHWVDHFVYHSVSSPSFHATVVLSRFSASAMALLSDLCSSRGWRVLTLAHSASLCFSLLAIGPRRGVRTT